MVSNRPSLAVIGMVALIALSGCLSTGQLSDQQEQQVIERVEERMDEIDTFTATMESESTYDGTTHETKMEITVRPDTGEMRQELLAPSENAGDVVVRNETHSVRYDADENEYRVTEFDSDSFDRDLTSQLEEQLQTHDVYYNGTDTVNGQQTHKVTLIPGESVDTSASGTTTVWLDAEKLFPVKMVNEVDDEDVSMTSTVTYSDVELNPDLGDDPFTFDPPADATKAENTAPDVSEYESPEEMQDDTDVSVPDPDVPDGFEFEGGHVSTHDDRTFVSMDYSDGERRVMISVRTDTDYNRSDSDSETVELDEHTGEYREHGETGYISWQCDDDGYAVGGDLDKSELVTVAASLECA